MAGIELVIKISEELYKKISLNNPPYGEDFPLYYAVRNGTPLPKGHGDLKDADNLKHAFIKWSMAVQGNFTDAYIASIVCNSPTIIKADKEGEQE